jgi:acetyl esterase/lipase
MLMPESSTKKQRRLSRRQFLGIAAGVGVVAVTGSAVLSRTQLMWQIGEFTALASLGASIQQANDATFDGAEARVNYGNDPQQYALVFTPPANVPRKASTVFFLHGGGWSMGNPSMYRFVGRFFAQIGYPTILGGYRLTPAFVFPSQMEDTMAGLRAGMNHLAKFDAPAKQIVLGGHSAGAQLASLMAYDVSILQTERPLFAGLFAMSGPLDFAYCQSGDIRRMLDAYIGHLPVPDAANPITHADPDMPISVFCMHGAHDPTVNLQNSTSFVNRLNQGSTQRAMLHIAQGVHHSDMLNLFLQTNAQTNVLKAWLAGIDEI